MLGKKLTDAFSFGLFFCYENLLDTLPISEEQTFLNLHRKQILECTEIFKGKNTRKNY